MAGPLQKKAFWGMIWSAAGNFSLQLIGFVVGVQLARILSPDDYGLVGMLTIFLLSLLMGAGVWCLVTFLPLSPILQLAVGIPAGALIYVLGATLFRMSELTEAWQLIRNNLCKS